VRDIRLLTLVMILTLAGTAAAAAPRTLVTRARQLYNQRQYDAAISTAREAMARPEWKAPASLVVARACLERYRQAHEPADLATARELLATLEAGHLSQADRTELVVGWAELLFLSGQPGAAAEMFDAAMARPGPGGAATRDRLVDWWAQSLELLAQGASAPARAQIYARMLSRMDDELRRNPESAVIPYWSVTAARGAGDVDRAWHAAVAGWIRASLMGDRGTVLRKDLDALVLDAVLPERARRHAAGGDIPRMQSAMRAEWETVKQAWQD
jgi:hypothetical protein